MYKFISLVILIVLPFINCQFGGDPNFNVQMIKPKVDHREVKCLVCQAAIDEILFARNALDPKRMVEVGSYRLDDKGNLNKKKVPQTQSEVKLSEIIDDICEKFDDYAKAKWKSNDKLTIIRMMTREGGMNPDINRVNMIQDDDLNRSLKYYCQNLVEELEELIISHMIKGTPNLEDVICSQESQLCGGSVNDNEYYSPDENDEL